MIQSRFTVALVSYVSISMISNPLGLSARLPDNQSVSQTASQSVSLSVSQSDSQLISQSLNQSASRSVDQPVTQKAKRQTFSSVSQLD